MRCGKCNIYKYILTVLYCMEDYHIILRGKKSKITRICKEN